MRISGSPEGCVVNLAKFMSTVKCVNVCRFLPSLQVFYKYSPSIPTQSGKRNQDLSFPQR